MQLATRSALPLVFLFCLACGGGSGGAYSGTYVTDLGGGTATLEFGSQNKVTVTLASSDGKDKLVHHCIYVVSGDRMVVTTDEPMGVPMTLKIEGDTLSDGGSVYRKK
jgi:hypothetical protein